MRGRFRVTVEEEITLALDESKLAFDTLAVHGGQVPDPTTTARAVPIYQTSSYVFHNTQHAADLFGLKELGFVYTRLMNPTQDVFEKRVALLEGGIGALATASGQAAQALGILNIVHAGDEMISSTSLYGGTYNLFHYTFPKLGITVHFVDPDDPENFRKALTPKTKLIYAETLGNPKLNTLDIEAIAKVAHDVGIPLMIDNTMPSPALCNPIAWGADLVVHSTTKFIGGHGTSIGGIIVDSGTFDWANGNFPQFTEPDPSYHGMVLMDLPEPLRSMAYILKCRLQMMRDIGACVSPFNAFLFLQGLETLHLRMERHSQNAMRVAQFLQSHPQVTWVNYPGLPDSSHHELAKKYHKGGKYGAIVGFGIKGGMEAGRKLIDNLQIFSLLANIGDAKSLVIHPASTTHQQLNEEEQFTTGVTPDFVRLSVGIEDVNDLIADLDQGLKATL